ncbi:MAG: hypothetical protein ACHP7O_07340 [Burkholderiales bacterium]
MTTPNAKKDTVARTAAKSAQSAALYGANAQGPRGRQGGISMPPAMKAQGTQRGTGEPPSSSWNWDVPIKRMSYLGEGYVVVQVDNEAVAAEALPATANPQELFSGGTPRIPDAELQVVFKRFSTRKQRKPAVSASQTVPQEAPADNLEFLEGMNMQADVARAKHVKSGALLPAAVFCERLQVTRQAVSKAVSAQRMFFLPGPSGTQLYPEFFTSPLYNRRDLARVSKALGALPGPSKWQFFTTRKGSLGGKTPLDALAAGKLDDVLIAAAGFLER